MRRRPKGHRDGVTGLGGTLPSMRPFLASLCLLLAACRGGCSKYGGNDIDLAAQAATTRE